MSAVEFSHSYGSIVDTSERIPQGASVSTVEHRGHHLPDKVRRVRTKDNTTVGDLAKSSVYPDKLIGIKIAGTDKSGGRAEPVTVFFNGHKGDKDGTVIVTLWDKTSVRRIFRLGDKLAFPTRVL